VPTFRVPGAASLTSALGTQLVGSQWRKARFPCPDGILCEDQATLQEHLGQITQAEFVAQAPQDDLEDDVGGKGTIAELGSGGPFTGGWQKRFVTRIPAIMLLHRPYHSVLTEPQCSPILYHLAGPA
jgi:hypothetical protein